MLHLVVFSWVSRLVGVCPSYICFINVFVLNNGQPFWNNSTLLIFPRFIILYSSIIWADQRKLSLQRANYEYLRGKILDVFPDYRKEAEDHLSKAVRTDFQFYLLFCNYCVWSWKAEVPYVSWISTVLSRLSWIHLLQMLGYV